MATAAPVAHDCDRLAAHPDDPSKVGAGQPWETLDPELAIPACELALETSPDQLRYHFQLGRASHKAKRYQQARANYRFAAERGYIAAQLNLGRMHDDGLGVPVDHEAAVAWYRKAAERNDPRGQNALGRAYVNGHGVPQDYAEAAKWYRLAAEQGQAGAQNDLGVLFALGWGVPQDEAAAFQWYMRAAEQNFVTAQYNVGIRYHLGRSVERDRVAAYLWYSLAAGQDHHNAAEERAVLVEQMSPEEIAKAEQRVRDWRPLAER
jgi:TPR repeat protein